jgi:hypothetical protein
MADRVGHGQHRQTERQRHADKSDPDLRERGGEHGTAATAEDKPKGAEKLGAQLP